MRKLVLGVLAATALMGASAANAVEFVGSTLGCFGTGCTPGNPATNSFNGLSFSSGSFDQFTSAGGFAGIGSGNTDTLGFVSQNGSLFNYTGTAFSLLVNFSAPAGVTGGTT